MTILYVKADGHVSRSKKAKNVKKKDVSKRDECKDRKDRRIYLTISAAINAASQSKKDTIKVAPGVYCEQIIIDRPVRLLGAQWKVDGRKKCRAEFDKSKQLKKESIIQLPSLQTSSSSSSTVLQSIFAGGIIQIYAEDVTVAGFVVRGNSSASMSDTINVVGVDTPLEPSGIQTSHEHSGYHIYHNIFYDNLIGIDLNSSLVEFFT